MREYRSAQEAINAARNNKEGTAYKKDGKLFINHQGKEQAIDLDDKSAAIYSEAIDIRDTARELIDAMSIGKSDKDISNLRKKLNEQYDTFKGKYKLGFHTSAVKNVLKSDTDYAFIEALEKTRKVDIASGNGNVKKQTEVLKGDIFFKNTINPAVNITTVDTIQRYENMLIAKGVPANEIAFIHDAKNDTQREELYDKVRSGKVRVLIGSSKKMGEGLNVQDRIVALHEMNPLARPGDIEQVEARAIRQGNMSPEVAVNVYVTKDTFDTKQWDTLRNKAKFIADITSGEFTGRDANFSSDEFGASAADIMAVSSGNPLLKEQVETNEKLRKLENLEKAHTRKIYDARVELDKSKKEIARNEALLPKFEADA